MWRREQNRQRGYDSEQRKYNKAQSVYHHRGELPVPGDVIRLVLLAQLIGDEADLLKDESQLIIGADARVVRHEGLMQSSSIAVVLILPIHCKPTKHNINLCLSATLKVAF